ncbi:MAG: hypothetical protein EI684_13845 [Candidatus Viridilinea halotolerans]|uniref:Uncharacterized protein n=1 Tax=Candidatus Viridilinea halotolerans TaxID=2491704 RepID=A0A426TWW0_9CHLR|nr:MAG: hypothetical protein EI684_13845 [Candidatus Viridilinea halotolerans]
MSAMGLCGVNPTAVISAVVFATLLLGVRAALLVALLGIAGVGVILSDFYVGVLAYPYEFIRSATATRILFNNWMLISGLIIIERRSDPYD